jgi:hypothetical protein
MATSLLSAQYEFNGVVSTDKSVLKNLQDMCTACGSWLTYDIHEGKWAVVINTTGDSVASFDDSNIIGAITVQGTGLDQLTDHCIVNFPHTDINDNRDFIRIDAAVEDRFPNEISRPVTIETDLFNDPVQAQLLGLIELKQRRIDRVIRFTTDFSMIGLKAGDLIDVTNSVYDYTAKMFRIISINEADADNGTINLDITALEYDAAVYDTGDLERYTITNETGIVSLGNISAPGTPSVTKYEFDVRPRLVINSTAPTYGSVNGMEFWYSTDVPPAVTIDANRTYQLLATTYANANTVFTSGSTISTEQDSLGNISLLVKTRGINAQTAGPFSTPSGSVTFAPVQVTDSISDTTQVSNTGTGSLLSALALTTLLRNLDGLFNSNASINQAGGGLFDKMFKAFQSNTGVDIRGTAASSTLPSQTGNTGKYLTTNGASPNWETLVGLPDQSGADGYFLTSNGSAASWANVNLAPAITPLVYYRNGNVALTLFDYTTVNTSVPLNFSISSTATVTLDIYANFLGTTPADDNSEHNLEFYIRTGNTVGSGTFVANATTSNDFTDEFADLDVHTMANLSAGYYHIEGKIYSTKSPGTQIIVHVNQINRGLIVLDAGV